MPCYPPQYMKCFQHFFVPLSKHISMAQVIQSSNVAKGYFMDTHFPQHYAYGIVLLTTSPTVGLQCLEEKDHCKVQHIFIRFLIVEPHNSICLEQIYMVSNLPFMLEIISKDNCLLSTCEWLSKTGYSWFNTSFNLPFG